ncbi:MAG: hypothetical protein N3D11_17610, partial [Candidatus Sumerlaeia bacterium]|nr:hypothetical protein [Candidatus Sumerlaeia bacterium]
MDRPTLKKTYQIAIAVAFGLGFALGYTLRNPSVGIGGPAAGDARDLERQFPGCRRTYLQLRELFAKGDPVRSDYDLLLKRMDEALSAHPDYVPFAFLKSMIHEDQEWNLVCGRYDAAQNSQLAASV